jgi:hypothetical protein
MPVDGEWRMATFQVTLQPRPHHLECRTNGTLSSMPQKWPERTVLLGRAEPSLPPPHYMWGVDLYATLYSISGRPCRTGVLGRQSESSVVYFARD